MVPACRQFAEIRQTVDRIEAAQLDRRQRTADRADVHRFAAAGRCGRRSGREFRQPVTHAVGDGHRRHIAPRDGKVGDHADAVPRRPHERLRGPRGRIAARPPAKPREGLVRRRIVGLARHAAPAACQRTDVDEAVDTRPLAHRRIQVHEPEHLHAHGPDELVRGLARQPHRLIDAGVVDHAAQSRAEFVAQRAHGVRVGHIAYAVAHRQAERGRGVERRPELAAPLELLQREPFGMCVEHRARAVDDLELAGQPFRLAALAGPEAGRTRGGRIGEEGHIFATRQPRRAGRAAEHAGRAHGIEERAVRMRIALGDGAPAGIIGRIGGFHLNLALI